MFVSRGFDYKLFHNGRRTYRQMTVSTAAVAAVTVILNDERTKDVRGVDSTTQHTNNNNNNNNAALKQM